MPRLTPRLTLVAGLFFAAITLHAAAPAPAATPPPAQALPPEAQRELDLIRAMKPETGKVTLGDHLATIDLKDGYRLLGPEDSDRLLSGLWHNPHDDKVLGVIIPPHFQPFDDDAWAVVCTYEDSGYVKDDEAATMDYAALLERMQKDDEANNPKRVQAGYPPIHLHGWAEAPHYDPAEHKLYWALDATFGDAQTSTLNYNIRVLGRRGVLVLNAVAAGPMLPTVRAATPKLLSMVNFNAGNRYADFDAHTDRIAAFGLAALIAGGVAAKAGLFKVILVGLVAAKKFVILAFVAAAAWLKKIWARITGRKGKPESELRVTPS